MAIMPTIDIQTARRYILGKQGLWPGRRWRGVAGAEQAMRAMEYLQLDPLQIIARSQDIALHSRVLDYTPGLWEDLAYGQRAFFDWGGWLAVRPMDELPYWRVAMRREREHNVRMRSTERDHLPTVAHQIFEQAEFARLQIDRGLAAARRAREQIEFEIADLELRLHSGG